MSYGYLQTWFRPATAEQRRRWHRLALHTAWVTGSLALILTILLSLNRSQIAGGRLFDAADFSALRQQVAENPQDAVLKEVFRQTDQKIRQTYFHRKMLSHRGKRLLLFFLALTLISGLLAYDLQQTPAAPPESSSVEDAQIASQRQTFRAIGAVSLALVLLFLPLLRKGTARFDSSEQAVATASTEQISVMQAPWAPTPQQWQQNWPSFRGPSGNGIALGNDYPIEWSVSDGTNILWKSPLGIPGHSSPVVWDDRMFLTGGTARVRSIICFDVNSGELLWSKEVSTAAPPKEVMEDTGYAAPTPVVDGRRVYAIFATGYLVALDFTGHVIWEKALGFPDNVYGYAASLAMHRHVLIVQYDQGSTDDRKSRLLGLDATTGQVLWQQRRPVANSWASPVVADGGNSMQLVTCADPFMMAYDPLNGNELWKAQCVSGDVASTPLVYGGMVFAVDPYSAISAYRLDGSGDVTNTHLLWQGDQGIPDLTSPLSDGRHLYLLSGSYLTCYRIVDGAVLWEKAYDHEFQSSPVLAGNNLYLLDISGQTIVMKTDGTGQELARSGLDEFTTASPAFVNGRIYVRTRHHLYCIARTGESMP